MPDVVPQLNYFLWSQYLFLALLGWQVKVLEKLITFRSQGNQVSLIDYLFEHPYRTYISFIGAIMLLFITNEMGQLNFTVAAACGFAGENVARFLTKISEKNIE